LARAIVTGVLQHPQQQLSKADALRLTQERWREEQRKNESAMKSKIVKKEVAEQRLDSIF
jgi:hypothetical protein